MIENKDVDRGKIEDDLLHDTITGRLDDILKKRCRIELKDVVKMIGCGQRKILIEGAPGSGKSVLALSICQQWTDGKLFQEYELVILVRLRDPVVHNAKTIADLLPRRNDAMAHRVMEGICDGNGMLIILDGWDELPSGVPGYMIIKSILDSSKLHESSVVITSRPTSSASLYRHVDSRIELLGFIKEELKQYFTSCLEDNAETAEMLQQRIKESPAVAGSCYLPLNASIVVHLFKHAKHSLPGSQFGIFSALVCNCIFRHMKKTKQCEISSLKSLDELPPSIDGPFKCLCEMAFHGVVKNEVVFDLDSSLNTLGLLQGMEDFAMCGTVHCYNFLHLAVQELLAAIYIASELNERQQIIVFKELFGHARFSTMFQFYAAKTKLKLPGISNLVEQVVKKYVEEHYSDYESVCSNLTAESAEAESNRLTQVTINKLLEAETEKPDGIDDEGDSDEGDSDEGDDEGDSDDSDDEGDSESNEGGSESGNSESSVEYFDEQQPQLLYLLHCLFEAQDRALCKLVMNHLRSKLVFQQINLNPADCLSIGYFLSNSKGFDIDLQDCAIDSEGCKFLFRQGAVYDIKSLKYV